MFLLTFCLVFFIARPEAYIRWPKDPQESQSTCASNTDQDKDPQDCEYSSTSCPEKTRFAGAWGEEVESGVWNVNRNIGATTFCSLLWVICHLFWLQENFEQKHDLLIEETELKQVAYIFSCNSCTLQIKGKINSIIVGELPRKIHQKKCCHNSQFWCSFASYLF